MDYLAHGFWSYIFFFKHKKPWYAVLAGLIPDTFSWGIYIMYNLFTGLATGRPNLHQIPDWVHTLYGISHSLVTSGLVLLALYLYFKVYKKKRYPYFMLAWPIAIVMDLLTHTREFLPTPFLWPISDWHFPGISLGTAAFMITNYILIFTCLGAIWYWKIKNSTK